MYITISPQRTNGNYAQSVSDYVNYLEKENENLPVNEQEFFFNHFEDSVPVEKVIEDIDANTNRLMKKEPKFYAITISPSQRELSHLKNHSEELKNYTRKVMEVYVKSFNRELNGRKLTVADIKYYGKIEHKRHFKASDEAIRWNQPWANQILALKHELRKVECGELQGDEKYLAADIKRLEKLSPQKIEGKRVVIGMEKPGLQTHIHLIVSRRDASNSISLSPGSKYKASEVRMHGKTVKRGFDRNSFFKNAEKVFDKEFNFKREFTEYYQTRKLLRSNPKQFLAQLMGLPLSERATVLKLMGQQGISIPNIPTNSLQLSRKVVKALKKGIDRAVKSSSIGI